jgi:hypothetical protein
MQLFQCFSDPRTGALYPKEIIMAKKTNNDNDAEELEEFRVYLGKLLVAPPTAEQVLETMSFEQLDQLGSWIEARAVLQKVMGKADVTVDEISLFYTDVFEVED